MTNKGKKYIKLSTYVTMRVIVALSKHIFDSILCTDILDIIDLFEKIKSNN